MTASTVASTIEHMGHQIAEGNDCRSLVFIGIQRRGVPLARRVADHVSRLSEAVLQVGMLDINLYRDDLTRAALQPIVRKTDIPRDVDDRSVVLVDDVLYTGRTVRAALDALCDFGRMRTIQLAVLIDRGHRELPIEPNIIGQKIQTTSSEMVEVRLAEIDGEDAVYVMQNE